MTLVARIGALSDIGLHRKTNEDSFVTAAPLFAVCDGMGGALATRGFPAKRAGGGVKGSLTERAGRFSTVGTILAVGVGRCWRGDAARHESTNSDENQRGGKSEGLRFHDVFYGLKPEIRSPARRSYSLGTFMGAGRENRID